MQISYKKILEEVGATALKCRKSCRTEKIIPVPYLLHFQPKTYG